MDNDVDKLFKLAIEKVADQELKAELEKSGKVELGALPIAAMTEGGEAQAPEATALANLIRDMSIPQKIKLAMFGNMTARSILLRDTNKQIPIFVLENPRITDTEIGDISKNTQIDEGILRHIGNNLTWMKSYTVKINLVSNPKTPLDSALRWLKFIRDKDLTRLAKSKNVPQVIASQSRKILESRAKGPGDGGGG